MSRQDLFNVVKCAPHASFRPCADVPDRIKQLKTTFEIMAAVGVNPESVGCEICKPAIASILSSLWNEHVMEPVHHSYARAFLLV